MYVYMTLKNSSQIIDGGNISKRARGLYIGSYVNHATD